jgi:hypothetical protein
VKEEKEEKEGMEETRLEGSHKTMWRKCRRRLGIVREYSEIRMGESSSPRGGQYPHHIQFAGGGDGTMGDRSS